VITYELTQLNELRQKFDPKLINKAIGQAMQLATTKLRTRVSRQIRQIYNIKAAEVSRSATIKRLTDGRMLIYTGRMIGLDKFDAKQRLVRTSSKVRNEKGRLVKGRRFGVTVRVRKDRGRKLVTQAFLGGSGTGGSRNLIFKREGPERLPINRLYGPSLAHMAGNKIVGELATQQVGADAATEFDRYLKYLMEKA